MSKWRPVIYRRGRTNQPKPANDKWTRVHKINDRRTNGQRTAPFKMQSTFQCCTVHINIPTAQTQTLNRSLARLDVASYTCVFTIYLLAHFTDKLR